MQSSPTLLILWDIDHTLIDTGGVGSEVYAATFRKVAGRDLEQMADITGGTGPVIFRETLALHGVEDSGNLAMHFAGEEARGYAERLAELRQRGRAMPGAVQALTVLTSRDDAFQSVLTGDTRQSARIKLGAFGLRAHLDLEAGAYGTDGDTRADLVHIARQRAGQRTGLSFAPETTVLIGDTPADVAAARDGQARCIAVASGDFSADELAAAGASTVLADLTSTSALLAALYSGQEAPGVR